MTASFRQVSGQVIKPGMGTEIFCPSVPFTIIPVVIVEVQNVIATG